MTMAALLRAVNGVIILICAFLVSQARLPTIVILTALDWQLKMALLILMMEAFCSSFLILVLDRLQENSSSARESYSISFIGIASQLISIVIVLPCMKILYNYSSHERFPTRYSFATHITLPVFVSAAEVLFCVFTVFRFVNSFFLARKVYDELEEETQMLHDPEQPKSLKSPAAGAITGMPEYMSV